MKHKKRGKRARRTLVVALVTLLALGICFGAGCLGSLLAAQWLIEVPMDPLAPDGERDMVGSLPTTPTEDEAPVDTPADGLANAGTGTLPSVTKPLPLPTMDKRQADEALTYAGSAGTRAYGTLAEAIDMVNETVVEIFTETLVNGGWLGNFVEDGAGSGVIISTEGYIVTNHHVIEGATTIMVRLTDGSTYEAQLVGADEASDIAVLRIAPEQGKTLSAAKLGCSADLVVGEHVFAIGNPLGSLGGTVTNGIISATARDITINGVPMTLLQTNAAVNPGNSGGGLFNLAGELIGVVNAKCSEDDVEGLGFAIPVDAAYRVVCELIEYGYVRGKVDSGLTLYDVTSSNIFTAMRYFSSSRTGVYVWESAYSDELLFADLIVAVEGKSVSSAAEVDAVLAPYQVGDSVTFQIIRLESSVQDGREFLVETEVQATLTLREYVPQSVQNRLNTP